MKLSGRRSYRERVCLLTMLSCLMLPLVSENPRAESGALDPVEITNGEYQRFIQSSGHPKPDGWVDGTLPAGAESAPVTLVTWYDAVAYCQWAGGKRLPTVGEWLARCQDNKLVKRGDIWEWTSTEVGTDDGSFKALCGPMGICDCSHEYRPHWKNEVKGFRCARDTSPVAGRSFEFRIADSKMKR